jgi:tetratricopeptide (TPR) repeat protein
MNISRKVINFTLIACLVFIEGILMASFGSEAYLLSAKKLHEIFRFDRAEEAYRLAAALNPIDPRHTTSLADYLLRKSYYKGGDVTLLKGSESLYQKAEKVNPASSDYAYTLGRIRIELFLHEEKDQRDPRVLEKALANLKKAFKLDPNGVNVSFFSAYSGISVWEYLGWEDRELFLEKMQYALSHRPAYAEPAYSHLWKKTGDFDMLVAVTPDNLDSHTKLYRFLQDNGLWQHRTEQEKNVKKYARKESPESYGRALHEKETALKEAKNLPSGSWKGTSRDNEHEFTDGNMYWSGTVLMPVDLPRGEAVITIVARGTPAKNIYPYMIVELDGKLIGETLVKSEDWEEYEFNVNTDGGRSVLGVTYDNDGASPEIGKDRNLYLGEVSVK